MGTKVCKRCKRELDVNMFYKDSKQPDGRRSQCKECVKKYYEDYYKHIKNHVLANYYTKNMYFPLAVIGYLHLKQEHGSVTAEMVNRHVRAPKINTEKAIKFIEEYINGRVD